MAAVTDRERERVRELHAQGLGRNQIAVELDRSAGTVTAIAKQLGLSFDRAKTAAATVAKVQDAKAIRAQLAIDLLSDARRLREQIWQPHEYIDHGGRDFSEARWQQAEPTPTDKLKLMQATRQALDGSLRLDQHDGDGSNETVGSLLGSLFDDLVAKHAEPQPPVGGGDG